MQVEEELAGFQLDRDSLITIGVFDGVHLGHKYLISRLKELAGQYGMADLVITFNRHPQETLSPRTQPPFLTDSGEKALLLKQEGVTAVIVLDFNLQLSRLGARDFISLLQKHLRMKGMVIGPDFALGRGGEGNISTLQRLGAEMGFSVTVIPPVTNNGDVVSSTSIRRALAEGDMEKAHRFLGRPFSLHGKVIHGKGRGTGLGFPTINLDILPGQAIPGDGVYATHAYLENQAYLSLTNIGANPTFGDIQRTVESFLLDYSDNLYQHEVKIEFLQKMRDEIKFANPDDLIRQIKEDIRLAMELFSAGTLPAQSQLPGQSD
ncbi:MAG: bifunctional riboflavin kinase/FAD synthetase [Dehalococcoidales bacterium]|nr:bifunctional riboflavin kinase/FAD synthetase [Dehalococcoidales bacterium]